MAAEGRSSTGHAPSIPPPRVIIEGVRPEIDLGRFPIKRTVGEAVVVEADVFTEGHDKIAAVVRYRPLGRDAWAEVPMEFLVNDRWRARFAVEAQGRWEYTVQGWVDHFATWFDELFKKSQAGPDVRS
jgi:starch synthase (maltosyl-transferring)